MAAGFSRRVIARTVAAKLLEAPNRREHWIKALAAYLIEHDRTGEAGLVVRDIAHELYAQGGKLLVKATSSRELTQAVRAELKAQLKQATGAKEVSVDERTDPSLLGGLIAQTPDAVWDISVRSRLQQLAAIK